MSQPVLSIKNLSVGFGGDIKSGSFLKDINLKVLSGRTHALVGASGSGKSLLCHSILRLLDQRSARIQSGDIELDGHSIMDLTETKMQSLRGRIGAMIFQEPLSCLNPVLTVGYQVAEGLRIHKGLSKKKSFQRSVEIMDRVGILEPNLRAKNYPHQLSGGERQRVMIAMAIACDPKLLIADEPTTALDASIQYQILELLKQIQSENQMGMLFVSHDFAVVHEVADTVSVLNQGRILETQKRSDLFRQPKHVYTKALLECRIRQRRRRESIPILSDFLDCEGIAREHKGRKVSPPVPYQNIPQDSVPLFEVKELSKKFVLSRNIFGAPKAQLKAVDRVSFRIHPQRILGLVGASGSGKSTLGRMLMGLTQPTGGEIVYRGNRMLAKDRRGWFQFRREAQVIFQDPLAALNPRLPVGAAVEEPMVIHRLFPSKNQQKTKALNLFERVGLKSELYTRYPHQLSGGERQRVCIARALALDPTFLLCDEPVSSLDVSVRGQILNLLSDLKKEMGLTLLFISHDLELIQYFTDEVLVMKGGNIVESGATHDVFENPKAEYTTNLLKQRLSLY